MSSSSGREAKGYGNLKLAVPIDHSQAKGKGAATERRTGRLLCGKSVAAIQLAGEGRGFIGADFMSSGTASTGLRIGAVSTSVRGAAFFGQSR